MKNYLKTLRKSAECEVVLEPEKRSPEEPYGWWKLGAGNYLMRFNETLEFQPPALVLILPHSRLIAAGASHAPIAVESLDKDVCVLLQVGPEGLSIKQNARISTAIVLTST